MRISKLQSQQLEALGFDDHDGYFFTKEDSPFTYTFNPKPLPNFTAEHLPAPDLNLVIDWFLTQKDISIELRAISLNLFTVRVVWLYENGFDFIQREGFIKDSNPFVMKSRGIDQAIDYLNKLRKKSHST